MAPEPAARGRGDAEPWLREIGAVADVLERAYAAAEAAAPAGVP